MLRLIHCADLHLSAAEDREYSLNVLKEIVTLVKERQADYLLFCGDIFNSFDDFLKLRGEFYEIVRQISPAIALFIWGNHELRDFSQEKVIYPQFDNLKIFPTERTGLYQEKRVEFFAVGSLSAEPVNLEKKEKLRIVLAHGTLLPNIFDFYQEDEDSSRTALALDHLIAFQADYYALGHIHQFMAQKLDNVNFVYPGSARVWRRSEEGQHGVVCIDYDRELNFQRIILQRSGQLRRYQLDLFLDCDFQVDSIQWGSNDWIILEFSGVVENRFELEKKVENFCSQWSKKVRKIEYLLEGVQEYRQLASNPFLSGFFQRWKRYLESGQWSPEVMKRARKIFLEVVRGVKS